MVKMLEVLRRVIYESLRDFIVVIKLTSRGSIQNSAETESLIATLDQMNLCK